MHIKFISEDEYSSFVVTQACDNFIQSTYTKHMNEKEGKEVFLIGGYSDGILVASALLIKVPILGKWNKYYAPRGFVLDYQNQDLLASFTRGLKAYLKKNNGLFLRIDPLIVLRYHYSIDKVVENTSAFNLINNLIQLGFTHNGFTKGYGIDEQVRWQFWKDLNEEDLRKSYRQNTRNKISYAAKIGSSIRFGNRNDVPDFYRILQSTANRQTFSNRSIEYFYNFYDEFIHSGAAKMLFVDVNMRTYKEYLNTEYDRTMTKIEQLECRKSRSGELLELNVVKKSLEKKIEESNQLVNKYGWSVVSACSIFIFYGEEVVYFYSGGFEDLMPLSGQYFLQDYIINYAKENGYKKYNFFGITGHFKNDGVHLFKAGFSGYVVELIGQFDLVINPFVFLIYTLLRRIKTFIK